MKKILILFAILFFLSCANMTAEQKTQLAQSAIQLIQIGMTIAQVTGILNLPTPRAQADTQTDTMLKYQDYNLFFQKGKLVAITPEGFK